MFRSLPSLTTLIPESIAEELGWMLIHSLWQFALIAALAWALVRGLQGRSAATRYLVLLASMCVMMVSPIATWFALPIYDSLPTVAMVSEQLSEAPKLTITTVQEDFSAEATDATQGSLDAGNDVTTAPVALPTKPRLANDRIAHWRVWAAAVCRPWLTTIVWTWCLGVVAFSARPLLSWYTVRRLRRLGVLAVPERVRSAVNVTERRLRIRHAVCVLQSKLLHVPVVVGYFRPVILLPLSLVAEMPPSQLEAILAHELAHVRRHDYLVNVLQTMVETIFFYHPAVWWLSHRIRIERENCCDDLAVAALGNRVEYGRALLAIEQLRGTSTALALGARSGSLLARVQRLFAHDPAGGSCGVAGVVSFALLALAVIALAAWASTEADEKGATPGAIAKLDGGVEVELLGVSFQPSENQPWWTPEGSSLVGDPLASRWKYSPSRVHDQGEHRELALEITGAERDVHARVDFAPGEHLSLWSTYWNFQNNVPSTKRSTLIRAVSAGFAKDEKQKDILVRLAVAPWRPPQVIDLRRDEPQPDVEPEDGAVQLRRVRELADGSTQVDVAYPAKFELRAHHEVFGEDIDGNEVLVSGITLAEPGARGLLFRCPQDRLAEVRIRFRWYTHEVTFRNVALDPEHATKVTAKVTKLQPPPEPKPTHHVAELADGVRIELLGVESTSQQAPASWLADGTPIDRPAAWPEVLQVRGQDATHGFVFRCTGLAKDQHLAWRMPGKSAWPTPREMLPEFVSVSTGVPGERTINLRVGVANAAWGPWQRVEPDGTIKNRVEVSSLFRAVYAQVKSHVHAGSGNSPLKTGLELDGIASQDEQIEYEAIVVDREGTRHSRRGISASKTGTTIPYFDVSAEQIDHLEYRLRPYRHWVTFEGVSLHPGQKTDVQVKVESLPEPPPDKYSIDLPDGLSVEFVGITKNTASSRDGWRPDGRAIGDIPEWPPGLMAYGGHTIARNRPKDQSIDADARDFLFEFRGLRMQPSLHFDLPTQGTAFSHDPVAEPYRLRVTGRLRDESKLPGAKFDPPAGAVRVAVTDEPWGKWMQVSETGEPLNQLGDEDLYRSTYAEVQIDHVGPSPADPQRTALVLHQSILRDRRYAFEIRGVDHDDQPCSVIQWRSERIAGTDLLRVECGLSQPLPEGKKLARFEYRLRPYRHWVTFENVSVEPGEKTSVNVTVATNTIVFLRHITAAAALEVINKAVRQTPGFRAAMDERLNAVIITADADTREVLQDLLRRLDAR